jgi:hypothetical protein
MWRNAEFNFNIKIVKVFLFIYQLMHKWIVLKTILNLHENLH